MSCHPQDTEHVSQLPRLTTLAISLFFEQAFLTAHLTILLLNFAAYRVHFVIDPIVDQSREFLIALPDHDAAHSRSSCNQIEQGRYQTGLLFDALRGCELCDEANDGEIISKLLCKVCHLLERLAPSKPHVTSISSSLFFTVALWHHTEQKVGRV